MFEGNKFGHNYLESFGLPYGKWKFISTNKKLTQILPQLGIFQKISKLEKL